jgi:hypothetical protein
VSDGQSTEKNVWLVSYLIGVLIMTLKEQIDKVTWNF